MNYRILFLGFKEVPKPKDDEKIIDVKSEYNYGLYNFKPHLPTIYDYHIVFLHPSLYNNKLIEKMENKEFDTFLNASFGGVVVTNLLGIKEDYRWVPLIPPKFISVSGTSIKFNNSHWLCSLVKKHEEYIEWKAHMGYVITNYTPELKKPIIATNITDHPISYESKISNGTILYLPFFNFNKYGEEKGKKLEVEFFRELLDKIKERIKLKEIQPPSWLSKSEYSFKRESEINKELQKFDGERIVLNNVKSILWMNGEDLSEAVSFVLKELGIENNCVEREGMHDIEINEKDFHAIIEVKGLSKYADVDNLRQLEDWHNKMMKIDEDVKGIFIVNDFKDLEPQKRIEECKKDLNWEHPFTKHAEKIARGREFCLLTTRQLFNLFNKKLEGNYNKEEFINKLKSQTIFAD